MMNMIPYHLQTMQQQQQNYVYGFRVTPLPSPWIGHEVIPVRYTMATFYPRSVEYVDDLAILNTMRVNQEPMHLYTQIPYLHRRPALMHPFEAFLEDSLMRHELEADAVAQQRLIVGTSGSGLSEEKISKHLHVSTALMV
ncbi:hypothetical protein L1987_61593 [Smallanthus sonchifolius]|uniref:Uncharacterized protein n=1 Tax=Smallanthus sonchifolius TaxID=185202 RepID=A0ACB9C861_9ASTR|nr:hypothetical protein L1987_61593 [Smallanthus sonchifolius]